MYFVVYFRQLWQPVRSADSEKGGRFLYLLLQSGTNRQSFAELRCSRLIKVISCRLIFAKSRG